MINRPEEEELIWTATYNLFPQKILTRTKSTSPPTADSVIVGLYDAWHCDYLIDSLEALRQQMRDCTHDCSDYYAKTFVFVQSSGMGKSRLADAFGESCLMINFILREDDGYPPGDTEILQFMLSEPPDEVKESVNKSPQKKTAALGNSLVKARRATAIWNHSVAMGLLYASFEIRELCALLALVASANLMCLIVNQWVETQDPTSSLKKLASLRHQIMAPLNPKEASNGDLAVNRRDQRIRFCDAVVSRASDYARKFAMDKGWRSCFLAGEELRARYLLQNSSQFESLKEIGKALARNLERFSGGNSANPSWIVVFDEATNLFTPGTPDLDTGRYVALNRVLSCLKELPTWFFMLSTESRVEKLLPPDIQAKEGEKDNENRWNNPSGRMPPQSTSDQTDNLKRLKLFPPFVSFRLDVEDRRRMLAKKSREDELKKPMAGFSEPKHISMFGRPLWFAYEGPDKLEEVAKWKLLGGRRYAKYDPDDKDHVLAALSFRVALDVCLENAVSLPLVRTAVNSHLRVVVSMDQSTGVLHTSTPSEPVLALAAMKLLCEGNNWTASIKTLTQQLLQLGLVAKGLKGELFARLVMILARDQIRSGPSSQDVIQVSGKGGKAQERAQDFQGVNLPISQKGLSFMPIFTVSDFLKSLYGENNNKEVQQIANEILQAKMNFTHFVPTSEQLSSDLFPTLCHDLLRRSAALQLCENQVTYDQLIPIYFGNEQGTFEPSQCGVILIQNKNRESATTIASMFNEPFVTPSLNTKKPSKRAKYLQKSERALRNGPNFIFNKMEKPILFLMFDIGTKIIRSPPVEVSHSDGNIPQIWAVHSRNHTGETFGCLKEMDSSGNSAAFFTSVIEKVGLYADIAKENIGYGKLSRDARYGKLVKSTQEESDSNEEKICYTSTASIALVDPQESEDIDGQEDTPMSGI